jgi:hypothetical protein
MIDFKQARDSAFEIVQNTRTVEKVSEEVKNKTGGTTIREHWLVTVEVPVDNRIKEFILEVRLKPDFPLSIPTIKLSEPNYEETKYLPHVDCGRTICLYDQENIKQNTDNPSGIVDECINQAVRILSNGLIKDHEPEFNDEIIAYWENTYHNGDIVVGAYLGSNMPALQSGNVRAHYLVEPHANINLYIGNQEDEVTKLTDFFKLRGHTLQEFNAFYLGEIQTLSPPFTYDNRSLLKFIKDNFIGVWKELNSYLNQGSLFRKLILFSMVSGGRPIFFGFYLHPFKTNFNGWRAGQSTVQVMTSIRPVEPVTRVRFTEFHPDRLQTRTDGQKSSVLGKKIMLAGLGSIGSNLLFYLSALEVSMYVLVDPEILALENINRHLLSFNEVGMKKVDAIGRYIKFNNPFAEIKKHASSIVDVIQHRLSEINELDLIFCAIGKDAIESYILQHLATNIIKKPVCLFWVEPYLLGAHVLYIRPDTNFALIDLEIEGFYKFNILANEAYNDTNNKLALREAGCQGSYMPYKQSEIVRFFASLTPYIYDIFENPPVNNLAITYVGDLDTATTLALPISNFANSLISRQIHTQTI